MSIAEKLETIAANQERVYDAGFAAGQEAGGGDNHYDRFWDAYQNNGKRYEGNGMFMGMGWNAETMKPKYDMKVTASYFMFAYCTYTGDLDDVFNNRGVKLEWNLNPNNAHGSQFFQSKITAIGTVDLSPLTTTSSVASAFNSTSIVTIRNLIPPQCAMTNTCFGANIENLGIGGAITKDMNLSRCSKLTDASVQSIIDNLADLTDKTTQTLTLHATPGAKLTDEQKATIEAKNWTLAY